MIDKNKPPERDVGTIANVETVISIPGTKTNELPTLRLAFALCLSPPASVLCLRAPLRLAPVSSVVQLDQTQPRLATISEAAAHLPAQGK